MKIDPKTGQYDAGEFQRLLDENSPAGRRKAFLAKNVGDFPTTLKCVCGESIVDAARSYYPTSRHARPTFIGPVDEDYFTPLPEIRHQYHCGGCGILYANKVIEGTRGYIPREKKKKAEDKEKTKQSRR